MRAGENDFDQRAVPMRAGADRKAGLVRLGQVQHLADTFTIIRQGRTLETGSLEHLRKLAASAGKDPGSLSLEDLFLGVYSG